MLESDLIQEFLESAGVSKKDSGLVAEMVHNIDHLVSIDENTLQNLEWPNNKGESKILLKESQILSILAKREQILSKTSSQNDKSQKLKDYLTTTIENKKLTQFLSGFVEIQIAARVAAQLKSLNRLVELYKQNNLDSIISQHASIELTRTLKEILKFAITKDDPISELSQLVQDRKGYALLIAATLTANHIIDTPSNFDSREFIIKLEAAITFTEWITAEQSVKNALGSAFQSRNVPPDAIKIAKRVHLIFTSNLISQERNIIFIFAGAIQKVLTESVPRFIEEAIKTSHPFLIRPLFRSYPAAIVYAVGGKLASSLETIWGEIGEELFLAMGENLRPIRNGGIDVVYNRDAYDIKSGPAVMNKDQVDVSLLKQNLIQNRKEVPGLDTFHVALVYGKASSIGRTMIDSVRDGNILPARAAWEKLTGDPLAPERIYALAGLVADIVGVSGAIEAASTTAPDKNDLLEQDSSIYDINFKTFFDESFDPPSSKPPESLNRLRKIKEATQSVRSMLIN
jgi:hypothetical protein